MGDHIELAYSSIRVFADDGTIDMEELNFLMGIALKDNEIDDNEKRVLNNIFSQVTEDKVNSKVWARMQSIREKYNF